MQTERLESLDQVRTWLDGNAPLDYRIPDRDTAYTFVRRTLVRFRYLSLGKADKSLIKRFLAKVTGLSRAQLTRLIRQYRKTGCIRDGRVNGPARPFRRRYLAADIARLAEVDALHGTLSGPATKKLCERAYEVFGDARFERLARISNGQIYNLRHSAGYRRQRATVEKTRPVKVNIGERKKPHPDGRPGFLRVDTVHQGDLDGHKGLYHINLVDEVTQFEFVGSVAQIAERCLLPVLTDLIDDFPFLVLGFHTDNGSEYVNRRVAKLLKKLHIEFTKSRPRHSNDNGLVESKNGTVVRKHLGHGYIPAEQAARFNAFNRQVLSPYLNYHRPCFFPVETEEANGRRRKRYPYDAMMTPYEKLKSLPDAARYLKPGVTFEQLDALAYAIDDNEAARRLNDARHRLFQTIRQAEAARG